MATGTRKRVSVSPGAGKSDEKQGKGGKMGQQKEGTMESAAVRFGNAENHPNVQEGGAYEDDRKLPAKNLTTTQQETTPSRLGRE